MSARATASSADPLLVTLTAKQLLALVQEAIQAAVDEVARPRPTALIDTHQLAVELKVSEPTVRRLRDQGMPFVRIGDTFRYELAAVLDWLRTRKTKAA